tara:strand:+ start:12933 stop:13565 length:633 start_codon:yes stop_codon:yes gene_type:complete
MDSIIKEACVEGYQEAMLAEKLGADRIELCSHLDKDGLTPERETILDVLSSISIPIKIMIRPRSGNFVYNKKEIYQMEEEISFCKTNGVNEVVFGVLDTQNRIDMDLVKRLTNISYPMRVTFHKAIDCSDNIKEAFEQLIKCKAVTSVLTSGKGKFVLENRTLIKEIIQLYKDKINIILAGGITNDNLDKIHKTFHCIEYHGKKIVGKLC